MPTHPSTLSIRRQRTGERRLQHRRRQVLRHRRRWDRRRRCRCTHRRTPLARRWRGWRLRSADQSSNSCVQSSAETMWTQEKKAEKRKKTLQKSLDNVRSAWYHRATPPRGGGGVAPTVPRWVGTILAVPYLVILIYKHETFIAFP